MNIQKANTFSSFLVAALLTWLFASLVYPVFDTPFSMGDDHRIVAMLHPEKMSREYEQSMWGHQGTLAGSLAIDAKLGRFRPAAWLFTKAECLLFGDNFVAWRYANLFFLFLSVYLLSILMRKLGASSFAAFLTLCVYVLGKNNETWWTLIPPAQNVGEMFFLAGMVCWLRFRQNKSENQLRWSVVFFLLSTLVKESFIFCIPFIVLIDLFYFSNERRLTLKEYKWLSLSFFIPFAGLLWVVLFSKQIYGYAYPHSLISILGYNAGQFFLASTCLLAPVVMFFYRDNFITRNGLLKLLFITLSWFLMQLLLLKGIRMDEQHHYLVPGLLLIFPLSALSITHLRHKATRVFWMISIAYFLFAFWNGKNTYINSRFYAASTDSYFKMCKEIAHHAQGKIIYMTHQPIPGDWLPGTSAILSDLNCNSPLYFCTQAKKIAHWQKSFLATRPSLTFPVFHSATDTLKAGDWVIFPDNKCKEHLFPWQLYDENYYENRVFENPYLQVSAQQTRLREKRLKYFGTKYRTLTVHSLLHWGYHQKSIGYYAIQLTPKDFE